MPLMYRLAFIALIFIHGVKCHEKYLKEAKSNEMIYKQAEFASSKYSKKFNTHYKLHGILRSYSNKFNSVIEFDLTAEYIENSCEMTKKCPIFECKFKTKVIPWINQNFYIYGACFKKYIYI